MDCTCAMGWSAPGGPRHALLSSHCGHVCSPVADSWPQARRSYQRPSAKSSQPRWYAASEVLCKPPISVIVDL